MTTTTPQPQNTAEMTPKKKTAGRPLDVDWVASHGPVSSPLAMSTTAAAVATLGSWSGLPPTIPLAVGAVGALGHGVLQGLRARLSRSTIATRAAAWLVTSGWTSTVIATDPHTWGPTGWWIAGGTLAATAIGFGTALHRADILEEATEEHRLEMKEAMKDAALGREQWAVVETWMRLIHTVSRRTDIKFVGINFRANGSGFEMRVSLPLGFTLATLQGFSQSLAQAARLPMGCLVHIGPADLQGEADIDVDLVNTSTETVPYPSDITPLSVLTGVPWGIDRRGEEIKVFLREACGLILGPPGSGKTNLLDGVIAGLLRCTDVVVWGIDLGKSGGAFRNWLETYVDGTGRPAIDWVAATPEEAERMLAAAEDISDARIPAYRHLMLAADKSGLLPVSAKVPEIVIIIDEGVEALASSSREPVMVSIRERIKRIMRTDREAGIRTILTATDGNLSSIGDTVVKKHASVRAALTSTDEDGAGASKLFGHIRGLDAKQLRARGAGVIGARTDPGGFAPQPFRTFLTRPSLAREVCAATESTRANVDKVSAQSGSTNYAKRWDADRTQWLHDGRRPRDEQPKHKTMPRQLNIPGAPEADKVSLTKEETEQMERDMAAFLNSLPEVGATDNDPDVPTYRRNLKRELNLPTRDGQQAGRAPEWLDKAVQAIKLAGPDGMKVSEIAEAVGRNRQTVRVALQEAADRGDLIYRDNGPHSVYVHPDYRTN